MSDPLLISIVRSQDAATDPTSSVDITLTVGGLVITGELIPVWVWARKMQQLVSRGVGSGNEDVAAAFGSTADSIFAEMTIKSATAGVVDPPVDVDHDPDDDSPLVIHMGNARLMGQPYLHERLPGGLWRGHLGYVSGWSFGRVSR